jgi:hypothetical protein
MIIIFGIKKSEHDKTKPTHFSEDQQSCCRKKLFALPQEEKITSRNPISLFSLDKQDTRKQRTNIFWK